MAGRPATLTPELLSTFVTVVRLKGDASAACEELEIKQPSMSKRLAYFQHPGKLIRKPWLERHGHDWQLTPEGERVLPIVMDLLRRYDHMLDFVEGATLPGLVFACGREAAETFVLDALKKFRAQHKDASYRVLVLRGRQRVERVASGELSLALVSHDEKQIKAHARKTLHVEELRDDPLVLACAKKSDWAEEMEALTDGKASAKAVAALPLILPEANAGVREQMEELIRAQESDARLKVSLEVGVRTAIRRYAEAGLGVGVLPRSVAEKGSALIVRRAAKDVLPRNATRLICRLKPGTSEPDLTVEEAAFAELLREAAK